MSTSMKTSPLKVSVRLEIDCELLRMADRLELSLAGLLEEVLQAKLENSGLVRSVSDINVISTYERLIGAYPGDPIGLRHCFRDK